MRLIDRVIVMRSDWQLDLSDETIRILKGKNILFAPSIMKCLENSKTQINAYDPFKGDVFSVGMVVLEAAMLEDSSTLYDYSRFVIDRAEISNRLRSITYRYSRELATLL
jgi:hypothetical protein